MLQLYAPESSQESWRSTQFGEGRRQRVRLGEMLIMAGQLGDLASEMRASPNGRVEATKAQSYYDRFTRYAHNHDVPASFRQHLVDMTAMLERDYPTIGKATEEKKMQPLADNKKSYIWEKSRPASAMVGEAYAERRQRSEVADIPLLAIVEEEGPVDAERSLIVEAGDVVGMGRPELEHRLRGLTENRAANFERDQAREGLEAWREQDGDLGNSTLRPVFDRYTAPTSDREAKRQRYLDIMQNEVGYLDALREGGLLNKLTSQWTEALYARVAINPTNPWRWVSRRGREDVMQARADVISSLRAGMRDPSAGLDRPQHALFLELAERYEELQVRDGLKERPVRTYAGDIIERRLGGEKVTAMVERRVASKERRQKRAQAIEQHELDVAVIEEMEAPPVAQELPRARRSWWRRWFG
jgi:hypothetical protein